MTKLVKSFLITLGVGLVLLAAFLSGYMLRDSQSAMPLVLPWGPNPAGGGSSAGDTSLLEEAYRILLENGLKDPPEAPAMEYGMIRGMLGAYDDPYTVFVEPPQNELQGNALAGRYGGIGAQLVNTAGYWTLYPYPESPARKAGVQDGDRLLRVDGMDMTHEKITADIVQAALRGEVGSRVALSLGRLPDYTPFEVSVQREEIALPSVTWRIVTGQELGEPGAGAGFKLGLVKVNLAAASTTDEIQRAVEDLKARGAQGYVLDLRDNPGGLLNAGVDMARLFLEEGVVLQQQYRGRSVETYKVERPGALADLPLAVLINGGTASAAEITAGALQAHGRAPLIGAPSYGKRTIQLLFMLRDQSSLHVTAARWWIPGKDETSQEEVSQVSETCEACTTGATPLEPDILVEEGRAQAGVDAYLLAALRYFVKP